MAKLGTQSARGVPQDDKNLLRFCPYDPTVDHSGPTASLRFPPLQDHRGTASSAERAATEKKSACGGSTEREQKSRAGRVAGGAA